VLGASAAEAALKLRGKAWQALASMNTGTGTPRYQTRTTYFLELLREEINALKMREAATRRHCSPAQSLSGTARGCTEAQTKPPTS
jgi:hypothetical protein